MLLPIIGPQGVFIETFCQERPFFRGWSTSVGNCRSKKCSFETTQQTPSPFAHEQKTGHFQTSQYNAMSKFMKMIAARQNNGRIDDNGTFVRNNQTYRSIRTTASRALHSVRKTASTIGSSLTHKRALKPLNEEVTPETHSSKQRPRLYRQNEGAMSYRNPLDTQTPTTRAEPATPLNSFPPTPGTPNMFEYENTPPAWLRQLRSRASKIIARKRLSEQYAKRKNSTPIGANDSLSEEVSKLAVAQQGSTTPRRSMTTSSLKTKILKMQQTKSNKQ